MLYLPVSRQTEYNLPLRVSGGVDSCAAFGGMNTEWLRCRAQFEV